MTQLNQKIKMPVTLTDIQDALQALYVAHPGVTLDLDGVTSAVDEAAAVAQAALFVAQISNLDEALKHIPLMWSVAGEGLFSGDRDGSLGCRSQLRDARRFSVAGVSSIGNGTYILAMLLAGFSVRTFPGSPHCVFNSVRTAEFRLYVDHQFSSQESGIARLVRLGFAAYIHSAG